MVGNKRPSKGFKKGGRRGRQFKKKVCFFCKEKIIWIDYKDINSIKRYTTDRGKLLAGRVTGTCAKHQRQLTTAVFRLRNLALLPYTNVK